MCRGETISLGEEDVLIETSSAEGYACGEDAGYLTALDTSLKDELIREGRGPRADQNRSGGAQTGWSGGVRPDCAGNFRVPLACEAALVEYRDYLMAETLATDWAVDQHDSLWQEERTLDDENWTIEISRT